MNRIKHITSLKFKFIHWLLSPKDLETFEKNIQISIINTPCIIDEVFSRYWYTLDLPGVKLW